MLSSGTGAVGFISMIEPSTLAEKAIRTLKLPGIAQNS